MNTKNLWGDLAVQDEFTPPVTLLRNQASALNQLTNHILMGRVSVITQGDYFLYDLDVVAPALDNYVYTILQVKHAVTFYPLKVEDLIAEKSYECSSEEEFVDALQKTLSSSAVRRVIQSLLSQSKALGSPTQLMSTQISNIVKQV